MDLGSGAGLPGVPLAIAVPEKRFTLCDRSERRVRFLQQVILQLDLKNASTWLGDIGRDYPANEAFDTVVARGVATACEVWSMVQPRLSPSGRVLVYESTQLQAQSASTDHESGATEDVPEQCSLSRYHFEIPGLREVHTVVCLEHLKPKTDESTLVKNYD